MLLWVQFRSNFLIYSSLSMLWFQPVAIYPSCFIYKVLCSGETPTVIKSILRLERPHLITCSQSSDVQGGHSGQTAPLDSATLGRPDHIHVGFTAHIFEYCLPNDQGQAISLSLAIKASHITPARKSSEILYLFDLILKILVAWDSSST